VRAIACCFIALAFALLGIASPAAAQTTRVSVATDGTPGNAASDSAVISGNGKFVAFTSNASNLVANDTNGVADVFVRDLVAHTTMRVSIATNGTEATAPSLLGAISADGNVVAFQTAAALDASDTSACSDDLSVNGQCQDIYVHNVTTGDTTRVSVASDGTQGNGESLAPVLTADGRYVAFSSTVTTLVSGDTNGVSDVFLHDRVTHVTTRVSVGSGDVQGTTASHSPSITGDGQRVTFISRRGNFGLGLAPEDDPLFGFGLCGDDFVCDAAYIQSPAAAQLTRVDLITSKPSARGSWVLGQVLISRDGHAVLLGGENFSPTASNYAYEVHDLVTGLVTNFTGGGYNGLDPSPFSIARLSDEGRYIAIAGAAMNMPLIRIQDRTSGLSEALPPLANSTKAQVLPPSFDATSRLIAFTSSQNNLVVDDTNNIEDVFVYDRDQDGDGMPSFWETMFGLDPSDPTDASLDPDNDGLTNLQEFETDSNPKGFFVRYFAEGAANSFFHTRVAVFNPTATDATVWLRLLGANGHVTSVSKTVAATRRVTFDGRAFNGPADNLPDTTFSMVIESDQPVVADRFMSWDANGYGSNLETSIAAPGTTWYLAEGATGGAFSLYYLLQNPGAADVTATVTYLLPAPHAPIVKTYAVAGHSRFTIDVTGEDPALAHAEVSAKITASAPIVVERSMYFSRPDQFFAAGHDGAGIPAPATRWFLAEGATGFFDEYVLIANPDGRASNMNVTYLLDDGTSFSEAFPVAGNSRYTLDVKRDPRLAARALSIVVESTNAVPVVVERVMWWPAGTSNWFEASVSAGVTATGTKWAMAEGELGGGSQYKSTYVLVANTDPTQTCDANVTLFFEDNGPPSTATMTGPVAPNSRATFDVSTIHLVSDGRRFGITVDCGAADIPIVVERSFYTSLPNQQLAAGDTAVATNITPP
jgi:hypothetical protein